MNENPEVSREQARQEAEYAFPYHYIARCSGGNFSQTVNLSWGYEYLSYVSYVLNKLGAYEFHSLLDVGCGDGRFLFEARERFPRCELTGIDISERAINFAKILSPDVRYVIGDITGKSLDVEFDVITAIEVLEHIPPEALPDFLKATQDFLKDAGLLVITVPSKNVRVRSKHYQHFDTETLREIVSPYFEISEQYFLNRLGLQTKMIGRLLSNGLFLLNAKLLVNASYRYYINRLLVAQEKNAKRICVFCRKRVK
jgi:2-polyprenyl-3-methyl-5-hydroxy-6-metoxy-1,4-benzoquinol methylase